MATTLGARIADTCRFVSWFCLIAAVAISPWRFGGVFAIDHLWVLGLLGISCLALTMAAATRDDDGWPQLPNTIWPLLLALVLGCLQLVPLPSSLHAAVSNQGYTWWQSATDVSLPDNGKFPISLYPASTRHNLAMLAIGVSAFLIGSAFSRQRPYLRWTLWVILANGTALALFGMAQLLSSNGKLFWTVSLPAGSTPFASFVNRNHAAGYLNLCFAAALGLFVYSLANRQQREAAAANRADFGSQPSVNHDWIILAIGACCALLAATVVCTTSRGGALAGLMAFVLTAALTRQMRTSRPFRWLVIAIGVAAVALAIWLGGGAKLHSRLQAIWSADDTASGGRLEHWSDSLRASADFWMAGSGLGTYRFAYRPYETGYRGGLFFHAENQYLEALLEGGWWGLGLLCGALYLAFRAIQRRRRRMETPICLAVGTAGMFAIVAQAVHAFFDFGLYLPANAMLFGLMIGAAGQARESTTRPASRPWAAVGLGLVCWVAFGWFQLLQVHRLENGRRLFSTAAAGLPAHPEPFDQLALQSLPVSADFAEARLLAADIQLAQYQTSAFADLRQASSQTAPATLWAIADANSLHQRCHQLLAAGETTQLDQLRQQPTVQQHIGTAYEHLLAARGSCPLLPPAHLGLAQLGVVQDDEQFEVNRLETAQRMAPFAPEVAFQIGMLHLQAGRTELGFAQWNRCLLLSPQYIDQVMTLAASLISTGELIERVLPSSAERLVQIADRYFASPEAAASRARLAAKAERVLAGDDQLLPERRMALTGHIHRLRGEHEAAIRELTAAVALAPRDVGSRYQLAQLLLESNLLREAQHHATICQRLDAGPQKYRDLLSRIQQQRLNDLSSSD